MNLANLQIEWLNSTFQKLKSFQTIGRKIETIEQEIEGHFSELGLNSKGFTFKLHYNIQVYDFAEEVITQINEQDIEEWKYYRGLANQACFRLLGYLQIDGEVRIWPHHFDTGIYVVTDSGIGIGFGLAMEDSLINDPYFYMSGYASESSLKFENLPDLKNGKWINTEKWKGAVLPMSELNELSTTYHDRATKDFMLDALNWYLNNHQ